MILNKLCIYKFKINYHFIDIVTEFKYLREITGHTNNEKSTWINRTKKTGKIQFTNKKGLPIKANCPLQDCDSASSIVTQPEYHIAVKPFQVYKSKQK